MNREIKFRAWDNEHKKWRYGWLTKLVEGIRKFFAIISEEGEDKELVRYYIHHEKSIGQYTGLKDKNGTEIYEGDIVSYQDQWGDHISESTTVALQVRWDEDSASWEAKGEYDEYMLDINRYIEVIGNIYENPELIEK